jgi:hypothetical protein
MILRLIAFGQVDRINLTIAVCWPHGIGISMIGTRELTTKNTTARDQQELEKQNSKEKIEK